MQYTVEIVDDKGRNLKIGRELAEKLHLSHVKHSNIRFGLKVADVTLLVDDELGNKISLSKRVINKLNIPTACSYNIAVKNNEILLGPFIGIYMGRREATLKRKIRLINSYVVNYEELNGVIFAFTLDNVNKADLTMGGYFYNPREDRWEKAVLPYPASVFRKNTYNIEWREHFGSLYGDRIYNYKTIDKWEMYNRLSQFSELRTYLPHTVKYNKIDHVLSMLNQYKNIYVKPITGKKGMGIFNIVFMDHKYIVKTREKTENIEWEFKSESELSTFLTEKLTKGKYIIQNTIDIKVDNKVIDFRIGMDKDQKGSWNNIMAVSRVSGDNSIVSNRAISGGVIRLVPDVLGDVYGMDRQKVEDYQKKLVSIAHKVSEKLEETGLNLGKLAFDFAIDKNHDIWIIEVNSKYPDDSLTDGIDNRETYFKIRHTNMLYSKYLAGFGTEDQDMWKFQEDVVEVEKTSKYKVYIAIPFNKKDEYQAFVKETSKEHDIHLNVQFNEKIKKVVLEVEGKEHMINQFLHNIRRGQDHSDKTIIGIEDITKD